MALQEKIENAEGTFRNSTTTKKINCFQKQNKINHQRFLFLKPISHQFYHHRRDKLLEITQQSFCCYTFLCISLIYELLRMGSDDTRLISINIKGHHQFVNSLTQLLTGPRSTKITFRENMANNSFHPVDYVLFAGTLSISMAIGIYYR